MLNSRLDALTAAQLHLLAQTTPGSPYPEVTDVILPSSLTKVLPISLVYSTYPPASVVGTDHYYL